MPDYEKMSDREIDAAVAERVMGWELETFHAIPGLSNPYTNYVTQDGVGMGSPDRFPFSTDANAARLVGERMWELGWGERWIDALMLHMECQHFSKGADAFYAMVMATPRQLCEAALRVVDQHEKPNDEQD